MAIAITAQISKKAPIPGIQMSSRQSSLEITGEVSDLAQVATEAARLFALAEAAVNHQLGLTAPVTPSTSSNATSATPAATSFPATAPQPARPSRPYQRRIAPVTDAQLRLIDRLIAETQTDPGAVLQHFGVGTLANLTCADGSTLISELKVRQAGARS